MGLVYMHRSSINLQLSPDAQSFNPPFSGENSSDHVPAYSIVYSD
jgi:hypothetical protein